MNEKSTARMTGVLYLLLAVFGAAGFLGVRTAIFDSTSVAKTAQHLLAHASLARLGVGLELATVVTQALVALWFFKLFRGVNDFSAAAIAAFGLVNAAAILGSAVCLATANALVGDPGAPHGAAGVLYALSAKAWSLGGTFFGLWLIPMGHAALTSRVMPKALGWVLMVGGVGYVASALVGAGLDGAPSWLVEGLTLPATVGEFWMIGFLLVVGWRAPLDPPA